jgi:tRNA (guanine-N7-)-methyltransferase
VSAPALSSSIERFLIPWTRLDWPLAWPEIFGRTAPLGLELGFGNGEFLEGLAPAHPELNWIGVEISWASVQRLVKRAEAHRLDNVRAIQGDGAFVLEHLFAPGTVDRVFINHPDPWPKKRHYGRRLIQPAFLDLLARRLVPGGEVTIVTDHADYGEWIAEALEGQRALRPAFGTTRVESLPGRARTKYERKGVEAGSRINYFVWRREGDGGPEPAHLENTDTMPNVMLEGPATLSALFPEFAPRMWETDHRGTRVIVQFEQAYLRADAREWLIETRIQEGTFVQHVAISVSPRPEGRLLVKPASIGSPRPTWGVKEAVRLAAEMVLAAHPGLAVHSSSVGDPAGPEGVD